MWGLSMAARKKRDGLAFYFGPDQAADYLDISRRTLDRWRQVGLVSCVKVGGRLVRYRRRDLDEMMSKHLCRVNMIEEV